MPVPQTSQRRSFFGLRMACSSFGCRGSTADGGSQLFLLGVIDFDDVAIDQHLAGIRPEVVRPQLAHFVLDEIQFLLVQADFLADGSRAV